MGIVQPESAHVVNNGLADVLQFSGISRRRQRPFIETFEPTNQ